MKKNILLIISLFLTVTISAQDISSALRQAQARFKSGNETGGIELVNKILAKYPDNKEAKDLLAEFNHIIKNREIDVDWKIAQEKNTFESYQVFRSNHPGSKYDDTASDTMAKKLADRFTVNSTYADRTKAESYAKKTMTKDYIANKWKTAMSKKTKSSSTYTSSASSSNNTYSSSSSNSSSSRNYSSGSSSYPSTRSSSSGYSYGSKSSRTTQYWYREKTITFGFDYSFDTDCFIGDLKGSSPGIIMRLGTFGGFFNGVVGLKYNSWSANKNYSDYGYSLSKDMKNFHSFGMPVILNFNYIPGDLVGVSAYIGGGYEFNLGSREKMSGSWIFQMGFGGRHWDCRFFTRSFDSAPVKIMEDEEVCGFGFTIYL